MRTWTPSIPPSARRGAVAEASDLFARLVAHLGEPEFGGEALRGLADVVPTASLSSEALKPSSSGETSSQRESTCPVWRSAGVWW